MKGATLDWISAGAALFSAIGTVGAVVVAFSLARRDENLRLRVAIATVACWRGPEQEHGFALR